MTQAEFYREAAEMQDARAWGEPWYGDSWNWPARGVAEGHARAWLVDFWSRFGAFNNNEHRILSLLLMAEMVETGDA